MLPAVVTLVLAAAAAAARQDSGDESTSPREQAGREIAAAEAAGRRVLELEAHADFAEANRRDGTLASSLERAQRLLRAAKSGLASAERRQSETGFSDASLLARRAAWQYEAYEQSVREAFRRLEAERAPPPPAAEADKKVEPQRSAAQSAREPAAEPGVEAAGPASPDAPLPVVAPPPPPVAPPPPRPSGPPEKLRQAADAYFAGDYQKTVDLLSATAFSQKKARAHALLLRAAARYALFLLGDETDYGLRGQAIEDVAACRRADPGLKPDEGLFSPRFRDFFAATR